MPPHLALHVGRRGPRLPLDEPQAREGFGRGMDMGLANAPVAA